MSGPPSQVSYAGPFLASVSFQVISAPATRVIALAAALTAPIVLYLVVGAVARPLWRRRVAREDLEPI